MPVNVRAIEESFGNVYLSRPVECFYLKGLSNQLNHYSGLNYISLACESSFKNPS